MKTRIIITLTALLMLAGINANAQNGNLNPSTSPIIGDLNNDNKVDAADVVALVNLINDLSNNVVLIANQVELVSNENSLFAKADINIDGSINAADIDALVGQIMDDVRIAAVDITNDTEYADKLLLCSNGSYVICDGENDRGYTVIHVNEESKDVADGITIFIDKNGDPVMTSTPDGHFLFYNVENDNFDFAFINNQDEITYYEDIKFDFQSPIVNATRGVLDLYTDAFTGGWDEHSKKALKFYAIKCLSFVITGTLACYGGISGIYGYCVTLTNELFKSFGERTEYDDKTAYYLDMSSLGLSGIDSAIKPSLKKFRNFSLSYLAYRLNKYADEELDKMGIFEQSVAPHFNGEEWQITLDPDVLEFSADKDGKVVNIKTKAKWVLDKSKFDDSWCTIVNQTDEQIGIRVSENYDLSERACYLFFYSPYSNDIFTKSLVIRQCGSKFKLSKRVIVFNPVKSSETVYCQPYGTSYKIKNCPKWCTANKNSLGYNLFVEKSLYEERQEELVITAIVGDEEIDRSVLLIQKPLCPDTNHPHMIDLGLPSGTKWSCCNAGASSPEKMGNYYSWGNHSPLSDNFDKDYPYKEWRDINHNGIHDTQTWEETFIKLDEAYSSATSGGWGNGSMPSRDDYKELMENCEKTQYGGTLGNQNGYYYTSKVNNNCIFIPSTYELEYWIYSTENNWAWYFNPSHPLPTNGLPGGSLGDPEIISGNDKAKYCGGRAVRPVSK